VTSADHECPACSGRQTGPFMVRRTVIPIFDYKQGLLGTAYGECRDLAYPARLSFPTGHNNP
jgi:hypothetical protein